MKRAQLRHRVGEPQQIEASGKPLSAAMQGPGAQAPGRRTAVLVAHGMGQQVPFETLDATARGLIQAAGSRFNEPVTARTVRIGSEKLQRLELQIRDASHGEMELHVYEAYWAPLTEGRLTLRSVIQFLYRAGINGLRNSRGKFRLWLFGGFENPPIAATTSTYLLLALLVVSALVLMNSLIAVVVGSQVLGTSGSWPSDSLLPVLNTITAAYVAIALVFGTSLWLALWLKRRLAGTSVWWRGYNRAVAILFWTWLSATIAAGALFIAVAIADYFGSLPAFPWIAMSTWWLLVWLGLLYVSYRVRGLLVQYVGDVVAYLSSHTLDAFHELRQEIKRTVYVPARAIYEAVGPDGRRLYDAVALIGHSLGSVVAYDTLNALLNDDELAKRPLEVAGRTRLLATFGSPLDKVAFIFARLDASDHQRALAASVQPLIQDYAKYRQLKWLNVWAPRDIISGKLDFFDTIEAGASQKVDSVVDPDAIIPLVAHTEYWTNPTLFRRVCDALLVPGKPMPAETAQEPVARESN